MNYQRINLSNASPTYSVPFDAFVFAENAANNDFDNGAAVLIEYANRSFTPGGVAVLCNSSSYTCPLFKVQAGDLVRLSVNGPTNIVLFVMRLADI